jgi:hypothetical protein
VEIFFKILYFYPRFALKLVKGQLESEEIESDKLTVPLSPILLSLKYNILGKL